MRCSNCGTNRNWVDHHRTLRVSAAIAALTVAGAGTAHAADYTKANNGTALNAAGSYTSGGPPGSGDRIMVTSAMTANQSAPLGGDLAIAGIVVDATATKVLTIGGSNTLTLGSSGISILSTLSGAGITFNGPAIKLDADQAWDFGGKGVTFNSTTSVNENGKALTLTGTGGQIFFHNGTSSLGAQINGAVALTLDSSPGTANLTLTNANSMFTAGAAISSGSTLSATSMKVGAGNASAVGTGTVQVKGGTFKYTGNSATTSQTIAHDSRFVSTVEVTTSGQTLTVTTFNNTNSSNTSLTANGLNLGGAGNLLISDNITESTQALRTATTVSKFGAGTLTLQQTVANTYTGATTVSEGSLVLASAANINSSASVSVASGATLTNNSSVSVTRPLTLGEGAVLNGSGAFAPSSLTVTGDLADGFTTFNLGLAALTKAGTLELTLSNPATGIYSLLTGGSPTGAYGSVTIGGTPLSSTGSGNFSGTINTLTYTFTNATNQLAVTPEPASLSLLMLGGMGLLRRSRR